MPPQLDGGGRVLILALNALTASGAVHEAGAGGTFLGGMSSVAGSKGCAWEV